MLDGQVIYPAWVIDHKNKFIFQAQAVAVDSDRVAIYYRPIEEQAWRPLK